MIIKVCGLKEPDNIQEVLKVAPDMVGFIFFNKSPSIVEENKLSGWIESKEGLFGNIKRVGVFVDAIIDIVLYTVHDFKLDLFSYMVLKALNTAGKYRITGISVPSGKRPLSKLFPWMRLLIFP